MTTSTEKCIPPVWLQPNSMVCPKYANQAPPEAHCRRSITYGVAKVLGNIIWPLVGQSPLLLKNTQHFMQHLKEVKLMPGEVLASYDVKAFFTSVPMEPTINKVKQKLQQDPLLSQRTNMSISQTVTFLGFCLKNKYLLFQDKYYEQVHGAAMVSPISPLIANLFMEEFKVKAISSASHPPLMTRVSWMTPLSYNRQDAVNN